ARPTKSRCLYSQMIGRATRPIAGLVDNFPTSERRKAAIAASIKPNCLVIDFAGNSGRHKLITTADILGGKVSDEAISRAVFKIKQKGQAVNMAEALDEEERKLQREIEARKQREAARKAHLVGKAYYSTKMISPFDVLQMQPVRERGWDKGKSLSEKQAN